ncbi:MAG: hypothetical protein IKU15_00825 [Clostridia bacterium]|nr:hypothetical protein [Clostridia bacterium]
MKEIVKNFLFEFGHIFIGIIMFPIIVKVADYHIQWKREQKIEQKIEKEKL